MPRHSMYFTAQISHAFASVHPRGTSSMRFYELPSLAFSSPVGQIFGITRAASGRLTLCTATSRVEFVVPELALEFGEGVKVVGAAASLGAWDATAAPSLQWTEGNNWKGTVELEAGAVDFKLVKVNGGGDAAWEDGPNRAVEIPDSACRLVCSWGGATAVEEAEMAAAEKKMRSAAGSAAQKAKRVRSKQEDLSEKVSGLEKKVTKLKSMKKGKSEDAETVEAHVSEPAAPVPEPAPVPVAAAAVEVEAAPAPAAASNGVHLPPEMAELAKGISCASDGTLTIEFGGAADRVDAATLAARLRV